MVLHALINVLTSVSTPVMTLLLTPLINHSTNIKNHLNYATSSIGILFSILIGAYNIIRIFNQTFKCYDV